MSDLKRRQNVERRLQVVDRRATRRTMTEDQGGDELQLMGYWNIIVRYRWSILALVLMGAAIGILTAARAVPLYQAETRILVKYNQPNLASVNNQQFEGSPLYWYFYDTQKDIIRSRAVAEIAAKKLLAQGIQLTAASVPAKPETDSIDGIGALVGEVRDWFRSWTELLPDEWKESKPAQVVSVSETEQMVSAILGGLDVTGGKETEVLNIAFVSTRPELTAEVANAVADAYVNFGLESRVETMQQATTWLGQRLGDLKAKLEKSEQALQAFQQAEGLVDTENREKIVGAKLGSLTAELIKAQANRSQAEARYRQIQSHLGKDGGYESVLSIVNNPLVMEAHRSKSEMERKVSELNERYGHKHPKMQAAHTDLNQAERRLRTEIDKAVETVRKEYEVAAAQERELRNLIDQQQAEVRTLTGKAFTLAKLEREVEANRQLYETFAARFKEADLAHDYDVTNVHIIDRARVPAAPFKPDKNRIIFMSVLLALIAGVLLSILRARLDDTIKLREDVENRLGFPLLGMLEMLKIPKKSDIAPEQYVLSEPRSPFAEAVNHIRTSVLYSDVDNPPQVILVTSSVQGEGKTTLACNLALSFQQRGRCLLLEADLRKGHLGQVFGVDEAVPGIADLVLGECELRDAIVAHPGADNLHLLPAGSNPPNPLEVVSSRKFARVIDELRKNYDYIIVDGPPLLPVSDSVILGHVADALVFTVQGHQTSVNAAQESLKRLRNARIRPIGVVMQQVEFKALDRYSRRYRGLYREYYAYNYQRTA